MMAAAVVAFGRMAFLELLAYRVRYVVGILNYAIYLGVQYFLWSAVFESGGAAALGGFTLDGIITYFAVGWVVRLASFNNVDRDLAERVSRGDIVLDLLRPPSLLAMRYGQAAGEALFRLLFMSAPAAVILFPLVGAGGPALPPGAGAAAATLAAFLVSCLLAFHIFFLVNFIVGIAAVFFDRIRGLLWTKFILIQFLSGLLVPFDLIPGPARTVLEALPFRGIVYGPISIYIGNARGTAVLAELALQAAWTAALWLLARRLWRAARRKLTVQGG